MRKKCKLSRTNQNFKEKVREYNLGVPSTALYLAMNPTSEAITGQATDNVTPPEASLYFVKTECFCFDQQALASNATVDMPLQFIVDQELPGDIHTITLSYTLFDITDSVQDGLAAL